ncbi:hypothetical protein D2E25_0874 [Bifidobacterium goeldii]|uniref:Peroxidase n=1 Tax=Bifidobacterium goeldii TaxID=2306975 RepID=A0A430FLD7_9BIFI|nr:hypothetical protein [Bifidobacterium goeldii]RSX53551.1 hypothetical protein D2E25_0874 [Bifidobacterium goeldii]
MARIQPLGEAGLTEQQQRDISQLQADGHATNMMRTIARDHATFVVYYDWHVIWKRIVGFLGQRASIVYAHAISSVNDCQLCSLYFVADLRELGLDPHDFVPTDQEQALIDFARAYVKDPTSIPDTVFNQLRAYWNDDEIVALIGFAGQMKATNDFNSVIGTDLDGRLLPLQKDFAPQTWREALHTPQSSHVVLRVETQSAGADQAK